MKIGIDASRAFQEQRTGIEEYSYQVIKSLKDKLSGHQVILYVRGNFIGQSAEIKNILGADSPLPDNWKVKFINWPYFWTQIGLSLELFLHPVDILFVPSHVIPFFHPDRTIVTIHGLEYEVMPEAYSLWERMYMRLSIKKSCLWSLRIIAVSQNTKKDLMEIYKVPEEKITVIYEGVAENNFQFSRLDSRKRPLVDARRAIFNFQSNHNDKILNYKINTKYKIPDTKYLLFIGRLEERKNIEGIISAFEILKERHHIPHKLILAGRFGYGEKMICQRLGAGEFAKDIICSGFVSDEEKWALLAAADVFLFPTFYEGFGLPILEAQSVGVPVVASDTSSMPEVGGDSVVYCDPTEPVSIANAAYSIISNNRQKNGIIEKGYENVKRFSWEKCAERIAEILQ